MQGLNVWRLDFDSFSTCLVFLMELSILLLSECCWLYSFLLTKLPLRAFTLMLVALVVTVLSWFVRSPLATMPFGSEADEFIELFTVLVVSLAVEMLVPLTTGVKRDFTFSSCLRSARGRGISKNYRRRLANKYPPLVSSINRCSFSCSRPFSSTSSSRRAFFS